MTTNELKHQTNLQKWAGAVQECRSSGLSVKQWCQGYGITTTTYYRWERELLGIAGESRNKPQQYISMMLPLTSFRVWMGNC